MNSYTVFAEFYDNLTRNVGYQERADYFHRLLQLYGNGGPLLLDLACGTGTLSVEMSGKGYEVIGVDASYDMLAVAREKAEQKGRDILFLCQKMQHLDLYGTVDVVVCSLDSINHVTKPEDVQKIFQRVSLFLNEGGLFVFDANTIYKHQVILGNNTFVYDMDTVFCVWQNSYEEKGHLVKIQLDFFSREGDAYYRTGESIRERAYSTQELCQWLKDAGLELVSVYDENSMEPPKEKSQRLVYVAKKHWRQEDLDKIKEK